MSDKGVITAADVVALRARIDREIEELEAALTRKRQERDACDLLANRLREDT